jgi:hypothetical protein
MTHDECTPGRKVRIACQDPSEKPLYHLFWEQAVIVDALALGVEIDILSLLHPRVLIQVSKVLYFFARPEDLQPP